MRKLTAVLLIALTLLCGCRKTDIVLEDTVWKYGNDVIIYFYADGSGKLDVDGLKLDFTYETDGENLTVCCTHENIAYNYGLDTLPFFGVNSISAEDGYLYVGAWELIQVK